MKCKINKVYSNLHKLKSFVFLFFLVPTAQLGLRPPHFWGF